MAALVLAVVAVLVGLTGLGEPDHSGGGLTVEQLTVAGADVASQQFGLDPDRAGYLTAGGVIAIVLVLSVLADGSSSSARLRRGRQDRLAHPKLAVVGALGGVALTLSGWSFAGVELTAVTMIVAAGLGPDAAVFAGRAAFGLGRRRRLRRAVPSR